MQLAEPIDDGLIIPVVSKWSRDKHHFLHRYIDAFTTAMKDKSWKELHYIDLFAGAGMERIENSVLDWGSPVLAAQSRFPFSRLHLCDNDAEKVAALKQRVVRFRSGSDDQFLNGDANAKVGDVVQTIPPKSLCLAFLDPYGLHLDYGTLRRLSTVRADLIIFFPDRIDIERNWRAYYWGNPNSNLDAVLGTDSNWREVILEAREHERRKAFLDLYIKQIRKLGYQHFEFEGIPSSDPRLYWLLYCSRVALGAKIWRSVSEKKPDGQRTLGF